jgi:hypothetical protein
MLPVSLDFPFLIAPLVFSDAYLAPAISMGTCSPIVYSAYDF